MPGAAHSAPGEGYNMTPKLIETITSTNGITAEIVQHARNVYSLTITSHHTGHNRWGNAAEIESDKQRQLEHY